MGSWRVEVTGSESVPCLYHGPWGVVGELFFLLPFSAVISTGRPSAVRIGHVSLSRIAVMTFGRGAPGHRPLSVSALSGHFLGRGRVSKTGSLDSLLPGFCVPSCKSGRGSPICVQKVKTGGSTPSMNFCMSNVPCFRASTFSVSLSSVDDVRMLHKPRNALCKHGSVNKAVGMCARSPLSCRNACFQLKCNDCGSVQLVTSGCAGIGRRLNLSFDNGCRRGSNFFAGLRARGGTSGLSGKTKQVKLA